MTENLIENLTFKQLKEIANIFNSMGQSSDGKIHPMIGKYCIIRTYSAGVHIGIVKDVNTKVGGQGSDILLEEARRIWKWEGAFTLSEVAQNGVDKSSRIAIEIPEIYICGVIEIIPISDKARKSFNLCHEK